MFQSEDTSRCTIFPHARYVAISTGTGTTFFAAVASLLLTRASAIPTVSAVAVSVERVVNECVRADTGVFALATPDTADTIDAVADVADVADTADTVEDVETIEDRRCMAERSAESNTWWTADSRCVAMSVTGRGETDPGVVLPDLEGYIAEIGIGAGAFVRIRGVLCTGFGGRDSWACSGRVLSSAVERLFLLCCISIPISSRSLRFSSDLRDKISSA